MQKPLEEMDLRPPGGPSNPMEGRSRLCGLDPMGIGTPRCEGLRSYVVRLAAAHCVGPRQLIKLELGAAGQTIASLSYNAFFARFALTLNGLGTYAATFAAILNKLTSREDLECLTLLGWQRLLPRNGAGLLAGAVRWCPQCLREWLASGQEIYHPLVWSIETSNFCEAHGEMLRGTCPHCEWPQPAIPRTPSLGRCDHCGKALGDDRRPNPKPDQFDMWLTSAVSNMVAKPPDIVDPRAAFLRAIRAAVDSVSGGNRAAFCEIAGLQPRALNAWINKGQRPSLPQFLAICYTVDTLPSQILKPAAGKKATASDIRSLPRTAVKRAVRPNISLKRKLRILAALQQPQEIANPLSVRCAEFKLRRSAFRYWFPAEAKSIVDRYRAKVAVERAARLRSGEEVVREALTKVIELEESPVRRSVEARLRLVHRSMLEPEIRLAYERIQKELTVRPPQKP